jgi:hypothetical protein
MTAADELDIFPNDNRAERRPGETVELSAMWALGKAPRVLEARLFWFTRGKGTEDLEVVATEQVAIPTIAGERVFRFTLPAGPWSFSGKLISLLWAVELVADDKSARWDFTLAPDGCEIRLHPEEP